ncbi:MAG: hypothetical protein OEO82_07400 [Gammaproteobacteria bacterium]|nr:hypothetical protein [Gammaproteobacteria bacterium]
MNSRKIEDGLALLGAVLVMVGVMFAATAALADEPKGGRAPTAATTTKAPQASAARANREAADGAIESIADDNKLDLEIRISDHTSQLVAQNR